MKTGKAAIFMGAHKDFEVREYPLTKPAPGMVQSRLIASGICGTDLHFHHGRLGLEPPKNIGHEFVGEITDINPSDTERSGLRVGDAVLVDIACPCGHCRLCRTGDDANCVNMGVTNGGDPDTPPHFYGGYGEYNYSPVENLIKIPAGLNPKTAAVYACAGPTALHAFSLAEQGGYDIKDTRLAVVQGLGPVGMFSVAYLAACGVENIVAITNRALPERDSLARQFGATQILSYAETPYEQVQTLLRSMGDGIGADLVVEASGGAEAFPQGLGLLRNRGVCLVPGQYSARGGVTVSPEQITFGAYRIFGSSQYAVKDVRHYLQFMEEHPELHPLVDAMIAPYTVEEVNLAMAETAAGKNRKAMFVREK